MRAILMQTAWLPGGTSADSRKEGLGPPPSPEHGRPEALGVGDAALVSAEPGQGLGQLVEPGQVAVLAPELALVTGDHGPLQLDGRGDVDQVRRLEADA